MYVTWAAGAGELEELDDAVACRARDPTAGAEGKALAGTEDFKSTPLGKKNQFMHDVGNHYKKKSQQKRGSTDKALYIYGIAEKQRTAINHTHWTKHSSIYQLRMQSRGGSSGRLFSL
jgi:hypothetical protein